MTLEKLRELDYFFIIGRGRSGTTLLQSILDAHPQVAIPIESRFVIHLYEKYHSLNGLNESNIEEFMDDLFTEVKINFWNLNEKELRKNLLALGPAAGYDDICKCISLSYNDSYLDPGIRILGDKNPIHTLFLDKIDILFPKARYIHLVRDYRDNSLSHKLTFGENNLNVQGYLWNHFVSKAEEFGMRHPDRFLRIHYEQLAKEPEVVLKSVSSFLGIDFDPEVLNFHIKGEERHQALKPLIDKVHPTLFSPVNDDAVQKWKSKLTRKEIVELDQICNPVANPLGYQPNAETRPKIFILSRFRAFGQMKLVRFLYGISIVKRIFFMKLIAKIFRNPVNEFVKSKSKLEKN